MSFLLLRSCQFVSYAIYNIAILTTIILLIDFSCPIFLSLSWKTERLDYKWFNALVVGLNCQVLCETATSSENPPRIFVAFQTTHFVGKGLGLALTVGIMQAHHGAITVESSPDQGTSVKLLFPSIDPVSQQTMFSSEAVKKRGAVQLSDTILIADD